MSNRPYDLQVRLSLLAVVFTLVLLNAVTLVVIYQVRQSKRSEATVSFQRAAVAISREIRNSLPIGLSDDHLSRLQDDYGLKTVRLLPERPPEGSERARQKWLISAARDLPFDELDLLANALFHSEQYTPVRLHDDEYLYLHPVPGAGDYSLLVMSKRMPGLAFLEGMGRRLLIFGLAALAGCSVIAVALYHFVISPFKTIRKQAAEAGRSIGHGDEGIQADEVVAEYQQMIGELKQRESELQVLNRQIQRRADSLEEYNRYLLRSMHTGLITLDCDGNISAINKAASDLLQIDGDNCTGRKLAEFISGPKEFHGIIDESLSQSGGGGYREVAMGRVGGRDLVLGVTVADVTDRAGVRLGISVLFNDLTELVRLRRALESHEKMAALGEMAGGLAHQLRNGLGVISGYGRLAKKKLDNLGQSTDSLETLLVEVEESEAMICQFLEFARPCNITAGPLAIRDLLSDIIRNLQVRAEFEGRIRFVLEDGHDITIPLDRMLMKQALGNILENGAQSYDSDTGTVWVSACETSTHAVINVRDAGCGISPELIDQIFTPFVSSRPQGTGLGLSFAQRVVDAHGGELTANPSPEGGTAFTIRLPMEHEWEPDAPALKASLMA